MNRGTQHTETDTAEGVGTRRDLADLPEPRFLHTTPEWLRIAIVGLAGLAVLIGAVACIGSIAGPGINIPVLAAGLLAIAAGIFVLTRSNPLDWRDWINLAVTDDGLYLPDRDDHVIFVPWGDVTEISVIRRTTGNGPRSFVKLALRLPEPVWARMSRLARIAGEGVARTYTFPSLGIPGETLASEIQAFREGIRGHAQA